MHLDDLAHRFGVGKLDEMEETAPEERVRQLFLVVRGNEHDGARLGLDRLAGLVDEKFHAIEFLKEIVREFDVGLVNFVDQQNRALRAPQMHPRVCPA